jgi:hypothetical protein
LLTVEVSSSLGEKLGHAQPTLQDGERLVLPDARVSPARGDRSLRMGCQYRIAAANRGITNMADKQLGQLFDFRVRHAIVLLPTGFESASRRPF